MVDPRDGREVVAPYGDGLVADVASMCVQELVKHNCVEGDAGEF